MKQRVVVLIPAKNEEETIAKILRALREVVPQYDLVVINDGSRDSTGAIVDQLGEKQLRLISSLGYGHALQTGMRYALLNDYQVIVSIDADGQHNPQDVPLLVEALNLQDADLVIGSRFYGGRPYNSGFSRKLGQMLFSYLTRFLIGQRIFDTSSGFKAIRAKACEEIINANFMDFHLETIVRLSMKDYKIVEIPVAMHDRHFGRSMHNFLSVITYPIKTLLLILVTVFDVQLMRRLK